MRASGSTLVSGNVTVEGHRTSVRLEPEMWNALHEICAREGQTVHQFCTRVNAERRRSAASVERISAALDGAAGAGQALPSLTAALRVRIITYFRAAATEVGHMLAGHGRADVAGRRPLDRQAPVYQSR